jgi:integrase
VDGHIVPLFGDRPLGALRRPDCTAFVSALAARLAPSTVHTVFAVLRSLTQGAVADQLIPANPCSRVPLPRLDKHVVVPLPASAVSAMPPRYELAVWLAAGAGLREGEALGLTAQRVEFLPGAWSSSSRCRTRCCRRSRRGRAGGWSRPTT